jgi:hypothetical protein
MESQHDQNEYFFAGELIGRSNRSSKKERGCEQKRIEEANSEAQNKTIFPDAQSENDDDDLLELL